jgi:SAM-dependent methyltransferase
MNGTQDSHMDNIHTYLEGRQIYGDDFGPTEIAAWYADEKEGYASLGAGDMASYRYGYHAWNKYHAFRYLQGRSFLNALGFGSAYGEEFVPIISNIGRLTIVDPSESFVRNSVNGVPTTYVMPRPDGRLPLEDNVFDLITCLGVLHHIPNVSFVLRELSRVLKPGGILIVREPIVSMGDWRQPRAGLTKRERGIPLHLLKRALLDSGLELVRQSLCAFPLTPRLFSFIKSGVYNSRLATWADALLSNAFAWNINYHPDSLVSYLRPTSAFFLASKAGNT